MTTTTIGELAASGEHDLGVSSWRTIGQRQIDLFADATDDHQWIHVDAEAAAKGPFGTTVAHGFLTLSLVPAMYEEIVQLSDAVLGVNYGTEKIRFTSPVPAGSRVRLHARLLGSEPRQLGTLFRVAITVEIEGQDKPALAGEIVFLVAGAPDA